MGITDQWIIPIIYATVTVGLISLAGFGSYKLLIKALPRYFNSWVKYKVFKKSYNEKDVEWANNCVEEGLDDVEVESFLRISGTLGKRTEDVLFIFREIIKMKGGKKYNDRKFKESSLKTYSKGREED